MLSFYLKITEFIGDSEIFVFQIKFHKVSVFSVKSSNFLVKNTFYLVRKTVNVVLLRVRVHILRHF